jgi:hypothetical protein
MIRREAVAFLDEALKEAPGALQEVKEKSRLDLFVREATNKANQIELYSIKRGFYKWNWKDFARKATAEYARGVLNALEHRAVNLSK